VKNADEKPLGHVGHDHKEPVLNGMLKQFFLLFLLASLLIHQKIHIKMT
jgi:hypothetical protein